MLCVLLNFLCRCAAPDTSQHHIDFKIIFSAIIFMGSLKSGGTRAARALKITISLVIHRRSRVHAWRHQWTPMTSLSRPQPSATTAKRGLFWGWKIRDGSKVCGRLIWQKKIRYRYFWVLNWKCPKICVLWGQRYGRLLGPNHIPSYFIE